MSLWMLLATLAFAQEPDPAPVFVPPVLVQDQGPTYPPEARDQGIQGDVLLLLTIDETGRIAEAEALSAPHSLLELAALDAAWQLQFEPATQDGVPVQVQVEYRYRFDLGLADEQGNDVPGSLFGTVQDGDGLAVPNVSVTLTPLDGQADAPITVVSRADGTFKATFLASGRWEVQTQADGFGTTTAEITVRSGENLRRSFTVVPEGGAVMVVTWDQHTWREVDRGELKADPGTVTGSYTLTRRDIESTPGSLEDVSRAVHALPGIVSDGDMLATFNARGGSAGEVVFLLDRVPLDNPFHLAGFNSLFNPDMIAEVQFFAGTAPANVPSGTSAVLAVTSWDGSPAQDGGGLDGAFDVSASSLRAMVQGPIGPGDQHSFALAARRSYLESYFQVMKWANVLDTSFAAPEFGELSARYAWRPNDNHRVLVTAMRSSDSLGIVDSEDDSLITVDATFELENTLYLVSADHLWTIGPDLSWQTTGAYVWDRSYQLRDLGGQVEQELVTSRVYGRSDVTWTPGRHESTAGVDVSRRSIESRGALNDIRGVAPWHTAPLADFGRPLAELQRSTTVWPEASVWVQDVWNGPVRIRGGVRGMYKGNTGEFLVSPSGGISLPLPTGTIPKVAAGVYYNTPQDPRLLDPGIGNPDLQSERATHVVVGVDQAFPLPGEDNGGMVRVEGYRIGLDRMVVTSDQPGVNDQWSNAGTGLNRGVDVLVAGRMGRVQGMVTYSLLFAERTNPQAERFAQEYAPGWDQRHTLGASAEVQVTPGWRLTTRYSFHTGRPMSTVEWTGVDQTVDLSCVSCTQLGNFHNIDVRAEWRRAMRNYRLSVYVEVLNAVNFKSDFLPMVSVDEAGNLEESMFNHLPARPFLGVRADF